MVDLGDHADSLANSFGIFLTKPSNTATNAMPSFPLVSYQPLRSLYWFAYKAWIQIRLPFWHLYLCVFPCPHEKWSRAATIAAWLGREESELFAHLGITEPLSLEPELVQDSRPGAVTSAFDVISPGPLSLYRGPVDHPDVRPEPIGLTSYSLAGHDRPADPFVVFHLHGGAFVWGSGRPKQLAFLVDTLLHEAGAAAVYAPQYRLSGYGGQNPFPAALQDSLTGYWHLVHTLQIPPSQIVVAGDSSGGSLALSLVRYLEHVSSLSVGLPLPRAAVLVSPWLDPGRALQGFAAFRSDPHWTTDHMPFAICRWGALVYAALVPVEDPYITALGNPFSTRMPLLLVLGEVEVLATEGAAWLEEMQAVAGNRVDVHYEEAAPHDTLLLGGGTVWDGSAREVAGSIGRWSRGVRMAEDACE